MTTISQLRNLLRKSKNSVIDRQTKDILVGELKLRIRRDQTKLRDEVVQLLQSSSQNDCSCIQPILKRCYLQGRYLEQKDIRRFLNAQITTWPHENILDVLNKHGQSLEAKVKSSKRREAIQFPLRPERQLPSASQILELSDTPDKVKDIEPLPINGQLYIMKDQKLNKMLQKVLKLYSFLSTNSFIQSRSLQGSTLTLPVTVLGHEIAECRKKNLMKKKIAYIRNVLKTIPPLENKEAIYLSDLVDDYYQIDAKTKLYHRIRREYKKFLRKTYTIDRDFNCQMSKHAYIKAKPEERDDYF